MPSSSPEFFLWWDLFLKLRPNSGFLVRFHGNVPYTTDFSQTFSPCARDRKVVWNLQSDPWHVTEIGRSFEERSRESGVDRGDDGLALRVCLLFRLSSVSFSFIS